VKPQGIALSLLHFQTTLFFPYASRNELRHARLAGTGTLRLFPITHDTGFLHEPSEPQFLTLSDFPEGTCYATFRMYYLVIKSWRSTWKYIPADNPSVSSFKKTAMLFLMEKLPIKPCIN